MAIWNTTEIKDFMCYQKHQTGITFSSEQFALEEN